MAENEWWKHGQGAETDPESPSMPPSEASETISVERGRLEAGVATGGNRTRSATSGNSNDIWSKDHKSHSSPDLKPNDGQGASGEPDWAPTQPVSVNGGPKGALIVAVGLAVLLAVAVFFAWPNGSSVSTDGAVTLVVPGASPETVSRSELGLDGSFSEPVAFDDDGVLVVAFHRALSEGDERSTQAQLTEPSALAEALTDQFTDSSGDIQVEVINDAPLDGDRQGRRVTLEVSGGAAPVVDVARFIDLEPDGDPAEVTIIARGPTTTDLDRIAAAAGLG